jgi:hypothetical protein
MPLTIDIRKSGLYQEGKAEGKAEAALNMLKSGKYSLEEIKALVGLSLAEIELIKKDLDK